MYGVRQATLAADGRGWVAPTVISKTCPGVLCAAIGDIYETCRRGVADERIWGGGEQRLSSAEENYYF